MRNYKNDINKLIYNENPKNEENATPHLFLQCHKQTIFMCDF